VRRDGCLCKELATGIGHGKADDEIQRRGPRDFVLRRERHFHGSVSITDHAMQSMAIRGFIAHNRESGAYTLTDGGRAAGGSKMKLPRRQFLHLAAGAAAAALPAVSPI
jgi:hypothetical protein